MSREEKRKHPRRPMYRVVRYRIGDSEYADLTTNISAGGVFIKNFSPPPVGTPVELTIKGDAVTESFKLIGKVARVVMDPDPHKRGIGVEFTALVADSRPMIENFIQRVFSTDRSHEAVFDTEA